MTAGPAAGSTVGPVGVLALQGDFPLHLEALERAGARGKKVRLPGDLAGLAGLIIPGGESTTMVKLAKDYGLFQAIREAGQRGLPMLGTCAGAILLGQGDPHPERLGLVPVKVLRNAYGRQRESFEKMIPLELGEKGGEPHRCVFIRAPRMQVAGEGVQVLGKDGEDPVLVRFRNFLLASFHPELTADARVHRLFLAMCGGK